MNEQIRSLFPGTKKYAYLNSAAVSLIPTRAVGAVALQLQNVLENGMLHYNDWIATKNRARSLLAQMLLVKPEQIAFLRNTSDGISSMANGLKWQAGDNIVSFEREFPANYYPWRRIRDKFGVELRLCPERNGRIDPTEFCALIDTKTKVVAISAVQYGSGFKADLERLGRAARAVDALFVVDIIQGLGAMPFDLPAQFVDAASAASHKWLCAPEGCGILYLSERAHERIEPTLVGWISVEDPWDFDDREQNLKPNALAWESGTGCSSLFYGLEQSLKLLCETGIEKIAEYLSDLTDDLCTKAAAKNYEIVSSRAENEKSAIVCIKHRRLDANEIARRLQNENVIISPRGDRIRIAPHFYNNIDDIDRLITALT